MEKQKPMLDVNAIKILIRSHLWAQIICAMILGLGVGLLLSPQGAALLPEQTAYTVAEWLKLPGSIFLNLIQMVVMMLVTSSIILGICSSGDASYMKRVGLRIVPYFLATTTVAVIIGVTIALTIQPGRYIDEGLVTATGVESQPAVVELEESPSIPERIAQLIPTNIDQARVAGDMLQVVIFAIFIGIAVLVMPRDRTRVFREVLQTLQDISLRVVGWAMLLAPYAVFGLLADITIRVGIEAILGMSVYVASVILGLLVLLIFYLLLVYLLAKRNPLTFLVAIREVQLLAFSTSSSAAVMPLSMQTAEEKLGVSPAIAKFIVPLGATVNMDGTALYQVVAALFLCQVYGIDLGAAEITMLTLTTVGASIGSPSTPGVGIVILATILQSIGVPASGIALIIGVDRILDMCRTAINVSGDLTACTVMDRWLGESDLRQNPTIKERG